MSRAQVIFIVSLFSPETVGGEGMNAVWRGFATLAGSWIGGGANQTAMLEVYGYNPDRYAAMVAIDVVVANIWMVFLLYGAGNSAIVDRLLGLSSLALFSRIKVPLMSGVTEPKNLFARRYDTGQLNLLLFRKITRNR